MRFGRSPDGSRVEAAREVQAQCPTCRTPLIAKIGEINAPHWAHKSADDCDPWAEGESQFHQRWKHIFPDDWQEVTLGPHRADVVTPAGFVIEVQKSPLGPEDIRVREDFYGDMAWVLASTTWLPGATWLPGGDKFELKNARKVWLYFKRPVFVDFGGFWMVGPTPEKRIFRLWGRSKHHGDGSWYRESDFTKWAAEQRQTRRAA